VNGETGFARLSLAWVIAGVAACEWQGPDEIEIPPFESCEIPALVPEEMVEVDRRAFTVGEEAVVPHGINSYPLLQHVGYPPRTHLTFHFAVFT
jgi:hypothetical protein